MQIEVNNNVFVYSVRLVSAYFDASVGGRAEGAAAAWLLARAALATTP